jgi:hypothetical protein
LKAARRAPGTLNPAFVNRGEPMATKYAYSVRLPDDTAVGVKIELAEERGRATWR